MEARKITKEEFNKRDMCLLATVDNFNMLVNEFNVEQYYGINDVPFHLFVMADEDNETYLSDTSEDYELVEIVEYIESNVEPAKYEPSIGWNF